MKKPLSLDPRLALRFLFENRSEDLFVFFLGDHAEVQKLLRSGSLG
ncbi:MAG: hypothetical protein JF614_02795 [Acidobacteria bacterium]|nr:hypothetical protein [Acidobacteriota bacterium]